MLKHTQNTIKFDSFNSILCFPVNWKMKSKLEKDYELQPSFKLKSRNFHMNNLLICLPSVKIA
jgi:hypothetical protein